jgi:hypothetical protein
MYPTKAYILEVDLKLLLFIVLKNVYMTSYGDGCRWRPLGLYGYPVPARHDHGGARPRVQAPMRRLWDHGDDAVAPRAWMGLYQVLRD